nr:ABC transporter B family member 21-like [Tanacetum cinerariifolium]
IKIFARMEQVLVSALVQERLDMEVDKAQEDIASSDQEMIVLALTFTGDIVLIQDAMGENFRKFTQLMATFVGGFVIAFVKGWFLTLVMVSSIPPLVIAGGIMSVTIAKMAPRGKDAYAKASIVVEQIADSIRMEKKAVKEYNKSLVDAYNTSVHEGLATGLGLGAMMVIVLCSYALAIWYGTKMIIKKGYNGGTVLTVIFAVLTGSMSLRQASPCLSAFATGRAAAYKILGVIASIDPKMMVLSPTTTIDDKSSILSTDAIDQIVSDSTTLKKRKRNQKAKKTAAGDVLSSKVTEVASGESVEGKTITDDTTPKNKNKKQNKKKKNVACDILSAKVDEIVSGETVLDKAVADNTTPEMKKMKVEGKVNAIEGLSATDITESISGEMVSGKTTLPDVKMSNHMRNFDSSMGSSQMDTASVTSVPTVGAVGARSVTSNAQMAARGTTSHPRTPAMSGVGSLSSVHNMSGPFNATNETCYYLFNDENNEIPKDETCKMPLSKSLVEWSMNVCKTRVLHFVLSKRVLQEKQDDGTVAMHYDEHDECDYLKSEEYLPTLPNTVSFLIDFDLEYKFMVQKAPL